MITTAKANELLEQLFSKVSYYASGSTLKTDTKYFFIGLHTNANGKTPDENGNNFDEPSIPVGATDAEGNTITVNEYRRIPVYSSDGGKKMSTADGGIIKNIQAIMFPEAENYGWGTITHFGIFENEKGGVPIFHGELTPHVEIRKEYIAIFRKNKLQLGLDRDPAVTVTASLSGEPV